MAPVIDVLGRRFCEVAYYLTVTFLFLTTSCCHLHDLTLLKVVIFACVIGAYRLMLVVRLKRLPATDKTILITGCDSGFGNALARCLDRKGMRVFATCLSESSEGARHLRETGSERMCVVQMDVTSDESVAACLEKVQRLCQNEGLGLWAVVNNAGILCKGYVELQTLANYRKVFDVNVFGMVRVCKAFLPLVRKCKGRVINVSSVQGLMSRLCESAYGMSKYGAEGFSDSLRLEMRRFGVKVIVVEPGGYGLSTGLFTPDRVEAYSKNARALVDGASNEIKEAYGDYLINKLLRVPNQLPNISDKFIQPVIDAMEEAVLCCHPNSRYLVDGLSLDWTCMVSRLYQIFPAFLVDLLYFKVWKEGLY